MALLVVHPWAQFFIGVIIGCWTGAMVATGGILLMVGRKVRRLEGVVATLRTRLQARVRPRQATIAGQGSMIVMPLRSSGPSTGRIARVN